MLNHLLLKSFYRSQLRELYREAAFRFWDVLQEFIPAPRAWFEPATVKHLGALLLARLDGKSPVEYIRDESLKGRIRGHARRI